MIWNVLPGSLKETKTSKVIPSSGLKCGSAPKWVVHTGGHLFQPYSIIMDPNFPP
jgi:hypothetical protein